MDSFADRADRQTSITQSERSNDLESIVRLAESRPNCADSLSVAASALKDSGQLDSAMQYYLRALDLAVATGLDQLPYATNLAQCLEFCGVFFALMSDYPTD
jgi:hypothetical protein